MAIQEMMDILQSQGSERKTCLTKLIRMTREGKTSVIQDNFRYGSMHKMQIGTVHCTQINRFQNAAFIGPSYEFFWRISQTCLVTFAH